MNLFENLKLNSNKLISNGFVYKNGKYERDYKILGTFILHVSIMNPNIVKSVLKEIETNEIYILHLTDVEGAYVGKIRNEYNKIMDNIADNCFDLNIFKYDCTYGVIDYIRHKYNNDVEYLWEKAPNNAVARRKDNLKWYLAILTVKNDRLGLEEEGYTEVLNLRVDSEKIEYLTKQKGFFPAYHMNKKNWISIILDGTVDLNQIYKYIDESYLLVKSGKSSNL